MKINIEVIPHYEQRYPTVGDYWKDPDGTLQVRISKLSDWRFMALIIIHELWEYFRVKRDKIPLKTIDDFDMDYEKNRPKCDHSEPGDFPTCPYRDAHCAASGVERILASELGVVWLDYELEIMGLNDPKIKY